MRFSPIAALLLTTVASPTLALDFGNGFFLNGTAEIEYSSSETDDETLGYADVDLGYKSASGFGGFIGVEAFSNDSADEAVFYGALTYSGSFGEVQIGAPRNALDSYLRSPIVGSVQLLDLGLFGGATNSLLPFLYLGEQIETPLGLRYDGEFGALSFGVSYHQADIAGPSGTVDVLTGGLNVSLGNSGLGETVLIAGVEHLSDGGPSDTSYFLGAESTFYKITLGAQYSNVGALFNADSVELYGIYRPTEALDITASYLSIDPVSSPTLEVYGIDAQYTFAQGVFVQGGLLRQDAFGSTFDIFTASLGIDF